jgi:Flp pilus assembly protein TadD
MDDTGIDAIGGLGTCYGQAGRTEEEFTAHIQATEPEPDDAVPWFNLGLWYERVGRTAEAAAAFQRAKSLMPELFK